MSSIFKKYFVVHVLLNLMLNCNGMSNTPTYVLGTDPAYLQPTIQAIYSLVSTTRGPKRIIVLETDDLYGTDQEVLAFKELCTNHDTQVLRWNVEVLKNALDPDLKSMYDQYRICIDQHWDFEMIAVRALFPVLFNREVLGKTGYLQDFNLNFGEQFIDHFIWLDSDTCITKNLISLHGELLKVFENKEHIPQPAVSTSFFKIDDIDGLSNLTASRFIEYPTTSGGVVAWNLSACRKLLSSEDLRKILHSFYLISYDYQDEYFINSLLKFWLISSPSNKKYTIKLVRQCIFDAPAKFYTADKIYNIRPLDWIHAKLFCDFVNFYDNPSDVNKNQVITTWMSMYPKKNWTSDNYQVEINLLNGSLREKSEKRIRKFDAFLEESKRLKIDTNETEKEQILDKLTRNKKEEKRRIVQDLLDNMFNKNAIKRCQYIANNPIVLHWDQQKKPWNKIALLLLRNNSNVTLRTFETLLVDKNYYLDIADQTWLNSLIKWLRAEGESGDISLKQLNRIIIAQTWFSSLIQKHKNDFLQSSI